jgi:hypothetical protein
MWAKQASKEKGEQKVRKSITSPTCVDVIPRPILMNFGIVDDFVNSACFGLDWFGEFR